MTLILRVLLAGLLTSASLASAAPSGPRVSRRSFLVGGAAAAVVATQPVRAAEAIRGLFAEHKSAATAVDRWLATREAMLVAERTSEPFYINSTIELVSPKSATSSAFFSDHLPEVRLPVDVSTAHFSTTLAALEAELAERFSFDRLRVQRRGEQLRGVEGIHDTFSYHDRNLLQTATILRRNSDLGQDFDRAYVEGLKHVHVEYARQAEARRLKLREFGETFVADRKEWRQIFWQQVFAAENSLLQAWMAEQPDVDRALLEGPANDREYKLQAHYIGSARLQARYREYVRTIATELTRLEEFVAINEGLDIERVYEWTAFLLKPGRAYAWLNGHRQRHFTAPTNAEVLEFLRRVQAVSPALANFIFNANARLWANLNARYEMREFISPEALGALEDHLRARDPEAFAQLLNVVERDQRPYHIGVAQGKPVDIAIDRVLRMKLQYGMKLRQSATEQVSAVRASEGRRAMEVIQVAGQLWPDEGTAREIVRANEMMAAAGHPSPNITGETLKAAFKAFRELSEHASCAGLLPPIRARRLPQKRRWSRPCLRPYKIPSPRSSSERQDCKNARR